MWQTLTCILCIVCMWIWCTQCLNEDFSFTVVHIITSAWMKWNPQTQAVWIRRDVLAVECIFTSSMVILHSVHYIFSSGGICMIVFICKYEFSYPYFNDCYNKRAQQLGCPAGRGPVWESFSPDDRTVNCQVLHCYWKLYIYWFCTSIFMPC